MDNRIKEEIIKLRCKLGDAPSLFDAKIGRSAGLNRYLGYSASPDDNVPDTRPPIQRVIQDNDKEDTQ